MNCGKNIQEVDILPMLLLTMRNLDQSPNFLVMNQFTNTATNGVRFIRVLSPETDNIYSVNKMTLGNERVDILLPFLLQSPYKVFTRVILFFPIILFTCTFIFICREK